MRWALDLLGGLHGFVVGQSGVGGVGETIDLEPEFDDD